MNKFPTDEEILQMCREKYPQLTDADDEFFLENPVLWPFDYLSILNQKYIDRTLVEVAQ
jgi:hypothetical protein